MAIATFDLEKNRTFVAGLFWAPLPGTHLKRELGELCTEQHTDLAVITHGNGNTRTAGIAASTDGAKAGMMSAAAVVYRTCQLEKSGDNLLCACQVPDGRWLYVAIRGGVLMPDGDLLGTDDDIRVAMMQHFPGGDWQHIWAPPHWGMPDAEERTLESFLPRDKKQNFKYHAWWQLQLAQPGVGVSLRRYALPLLVLAALGLAGRWGFEQYQLRRAIQEAEEAGQADKLAASAKAPPPPRHPWADLPIAPVLIELCASAMDRVPLAPGGWQMTGMECTQSGLSIHWTRPSLTSIPLLKAVVPDATISLDGNGAALVRPVTPPTARRDEPLDKLPAAVTIPERFNTVAQQLGLRLVLSDPPPPPAPLPGTTGAAQPVPPVPWRVRHFEITTALAPWHLISWIDSPGLRLTALNLTVRDGQASWVMQGDQYAQ
jgi:hypothetical protein